MGLEGDSVVDFVDVNAETLNVVCCFVLDVNDGNVVEDDKRQSVMTFNSNRVSNEVQSRKGF